MAWQRPSLQTVIDRIEADIESRLTGDLPLLSRALLRVLARVFAGAIHIAYGYVEWITKEVMPDQAIEWLNRHAYIWGVTRKAATFATGFAYFRGVNGTTVAKDVEVQDDQGVAYLTLASGIVVNGVAKIEIQAKEAGEDGNVASAKILQLIAPILNIESEVPVVSYTVTYSSLVSTFDLGELVDFSGGGVGVVLADNASNQMTIAMTTLPVPATTETMEGQTSGATAQVNGTPPVDESITGGQDEESDNDLRTRVILRIQEQPSGGTAADYKRWALETESTAGIVVGAWVFPLAPTVGWVTTVIKAAGADPVPSAQLITDVDAYIDTKKPVTANSIVEPIVKVVTDMTIKLSPNTSEVQDLVTTNLEQLFDEEAAPGEDMLISRIRNAISTTGLDDYEITVITLTPGGAQPIDDISVSGYDYLVLGSLTYQAL